MKFDYIIIQSGGKGVRLLPLTKNRPKALVPINNLPLIFHLFQKFPDKKFIIIGDYKYNVLANYLETYAQVEYMLIRAEGEGNITGIDKALSYIPDNSPFLITWCDLLIDEKLTFDSLENGCYVGITDRFKCSWSFQDGGLEKISIGGNGVAGCFIFDDKNKISDLPPYGSFTGYLKSKRLSLKALSVLASQEVGTIEAVNRIDSKENRCRPYNRMMFQENRVIKTGLTKEAEQLIEREVNWYREVAAYGFTGIPRIESYQPLTMERIQGENIFKVSLDNEEKKSVIDSLYHHLDELHHLRRGTYNAFDMWEDYYLKTMKRLRSIRAVIPFSDKKEILINGIYCKNIYLYPEYLQGKIELLLGKGEFGIIHGDCTLTNTLIDEQRSIYFIDARGYFGHTPLTGDVCYDWAKVYYSIQGAFDQFNVKNFNLDILDEEVNYKIAPSGWEHLTEYFLNKIPGCDHFRIKLIHAIVWLSLASHCWEDYDSLCLAFYNGLYLLNTLES